MSAKLEELKKKQSEIETFFEGAKIKPVSGEKLRNWIVDSVTHFTDVGVNTQIISLFLESCEFGRDDNNRVSHGIFKFRLLKRGYVLDYEGDSGEHNPYIIPVQIALRVSRLIVDKYEDEERIVPLSLINLFDTERNQHIKISLMSVNSNYQTKNSSGMIGPLITATEGICKMIPELQNEENVGKCLRRLHEEKSLLGKYNINRDVVWALNAARLIRNEKIVHPKSEHDGVVTLYEVVGYAHLLVLFTDSLLASGEVQTI